MVRPARDPERPGRQPFRPQTHEIHYPERIVATPLRPPPAPARVLFFLENMCHDRGMKPSLYEFAGGDAAFLRLATAHHARCLADPEVNHPFSHPGQNPKHVERLAAYWAEVLGGPAAEPGHWGGVENSLVVLLAGNGDMSDLGRRFTDCFMRAAD